MIVRPDGRPASKRVINLTANPTLFAFLMTGDPMLLFSTNGLVLACRSCKLPVEAANDATDGTWKVECGCTAWVCSSQVASRHRLVRAH